jgi:asparagine N-glycosylation enzyme membrane subunit Stt3
MPEGFTTIITSRTFKHREPGDFMKPPNFLLGVAALIVGTCGLVFFVMAASNPFGGTFCTATTDACNAFARELARQDFINGFIGYSVFTTFSIIVLFFGRTKTEQVTPSKFSHPNP